jgi:hypothetical protein
MKDCCPHRDECLALKGQPIGMYHCPNCGAMVIAGLDTAAVCEHRPRGSQDSEPR